MYIFFGVFIALVVASVLALHYRPELAKKWANSKYRPYLWFAIAALYLPSLVQDVRVGKSFVADLVTVIAAVFFGAYYLRRNCQQKRRADR